jgi:haloacid dehalogenase-like hydrolase
MSDFREPKSPSGYVGLLAGCVIGTVAGTIAGLANTVQGRPFMEAADSTANACVEACTAFGDEHNDLIMRQVVERGLAMAFGAASDHLKNQQRRNR